MGRLGVAWNGNVDVLQRAVSVAESNDRDVGVRSLNDWLMIGQRVGDNQQTWLTESLLDLIGESTRGETTGN